MVILPHLEKKPNLGYGCWNKLKSVAINDTQLSQKCVGWYRLVHKDWQNENNTIFHFRILGPKLRGESQTVGGTSIEKVLTNFTSLNPIDDDAEIQTCFRSWIIFWFT